MAAHADRDPALDLVARRPGNDGDRAGGGVATEQRALRALEDLDPLDIVEGQQRGTRTGGIDAVDIDAHRRVGADPEIARRDAADGIARLGRAAVGHVEARHEGVEIAHVVSGERIDELAVEHLQGNRYVLGGLDPLLGRHDDDVLVCIDLLRLRCDHGKRGDGAGQQRAQPPVTERVRDFHVSSSRR